MSQLIRTSKRFITDKAAWERFVDFMLTLDRYTFDTEYVAWGYPETEFTGFSFGFKHNGKWQGIYVPLNHRNPETQERYDWQLTVEDVKVGLHTLLTRDDITLGGQNFKVEYQMVEPLGIVPTENVFDTMLVGYILNTNGYGPSWMVDKGKGQLGLKPMTEHVLGKTVTRIKDLSIPKELHPKTGKKDLMRVDLLSEEDLVHFGDYAIDDGINTGELWDVFEARLDAQPRLKDIYWRIHREFMFVLAEMEMFGVELDKEPLDVMLDRVKGELKEIIHQLYVKRTGQDFAPVQNPTAVKNAATEYQGINDAVAAGDKKSPLYPRSAKGEPSKGSLGYHRKKMLERHGLTGHPVVEKIKDDKLRPYVAEYPFLAHKIFKVGGDTDLAKVFFQEEKLPMLGEKFAKAKDSTAKEVMKVWAKEHGNEMAKLHLKYSMRDKLKGTYLEGLPRMTSADGRLRGRFNQTGARTGRLSSSNPNLTNQPTNLQYPIRRSYVAHGVSQSIVTPLEWKVDKDTGEKLRIVESRVESSGGWYHIRDGRVVDWGGGNPPWVMYVGDYSQLEIRVLADMAQDEVLIQAILDGVDIHSLTARALFKEVPDDYPLDKVADDYKSWRGRAKTANFGVIYGMGPHKFARDYGYTIEEAEELINGRWMGLYEGVARWIRKQHGMAAQWGYVETMIGQRRHLPAATWEEAQWPISRKRLDVLKAEVAVGATENKDFPGNDGRIYPTVEKLEAAYLEAKRINGARGKASRQAQNAPIQGTAANIVSIAQRNIRREMKKLGWWGRDMRMLLQVHDEIVQESHPSIANEVMDRSKGIMEGVFSLSVPLEVSAALGHSWLDTKE